jgi:hypothetical protein
VGDRAATRDRGGVGSRGRVIARRVIVVAFVVLQLGFIARGYFSDHKEFAFQMFSESSDWRADIVRVTADGDRVPVDAAWDGYEWPLLVRARALAHPTVRHHADAGIDNQLAFLREALAYVASHTPRDTETEYLEATVTYWKNAHAPRHVVLRSPRREVSS